MGELPDSLDTVDFGLPVELGQIGRELKKLWERESEVSTRASLINFAVYCEGTEAMRENTRLIMELTREHACRAILIGYIPESNTPRIRAWINAHCHVGRAGGKQVCCEQVTFLFEGPTHNRIPNILFSNLDSDLPLYLLWQGEFHDPIDEQLWAWVDRLIFDSQCWRQPARQFELLKDSLARSRTRLTLCDLNWTRSLHIRQAISQMFDHPGNVPVLKSLESIVIGHAPEYRSTAVLFAGWFAAQLKLELVSHDAGCFKFRCPQGKDIAIHMQALPGRSISRCTLTSLDGTVDCQRDPAGDFFRIDVRLSENRHFRHLLPAGTNAQTPLLLEEIGSTSQHKVYLKALDVSRDLL